MNASFTLYLTLSFAVGGLWVVGATVLADRLGPKLGGLVSGLPSTVALGLFFLASTQGPATAVQAAAVVPLVAGINSLVCAAYAYLVRKDLRLALVSGLGLWLASAYVLVRTRFDSFPLSLLGFGLFFLASFFLMERVFRIASVPGKAVRYRPRLILARGLAGGATVVLAVYLGKTGGPLWGGIFSTFPAMFISTMLVTYFAQGPLFSAGVMKSTMLSGLSVAVYASVVRWAFPPLGLWLGTLAAILVSYGVGLAVYRLVIRKTR